jgi:3-deoxy-D-manno-octulosonic-acid transferase
MTNRTLGLIAYRAAMAAAQPVVPLFLRRRASRGKELSARRGERLGMAEQPRPAGPLVWFHGASVGECVTALPVIDRLMQEDKANILVTSGTVASASVMQSRLPKGAIHQFVPVDTPAATARFIEHWCPDVGLFVDSDLWPNLVTHAHAAGTKLALVNARISERSFRGWRWAPGLARALLSCFDVCLAQSDEFAERFRALGCPDVRTTGSLKADAPPLAADPAALEATVRALAGRPTLVAAQTHTGEEETILPAHDVLRAEFPDLLTIIVPRHIERGSEIAMLCGTRTVQQRAKGELPRRDTAVYIADTMNELGLFYRLGRFAFVGGTLVPVGGHNPLEPARLHRAVLAGPHIANSRGAFEAVFNAQGLGQVHSASEIAALAGKFLRDASEAERVGALAAKGADRLGGAIAQTIEVIDALLGSKLLGNARA